MGMETPDLFLGAVLLAHLYPSRSPDALRVEQCRAFFDGPVTLAEDLMTLEP